jgi:phage terminase large subunit GpA-like protein
MPAQDACCSRNVRKNSKSPTGGLALAQLREGLIQFSPMVALPSLRTHATSARLLPFSNRLSAGVFQPPRPRGGPHALRARPPVRCWFKPSGKRNEALDRRGYAIAALYARPVPWESSSAPRHRNRRRGRRHRPRAVALPRRLPHCRCPRPLAASSAAAYLQKKAENLKVSLPARTL